jgi:hypothetical protein
MWRRLECGTCRDGGLSDARRPLRTGSTALVPGEDRLATQVLGTTQILAATAWSCRNVNCSSVRVGFQMTLGLA